MTVKIYEVGGHVRDSLIGIKSKDIDMAVEASSWSEMHEYVENNTKKIFQERPEFLTIRAMGYDGLVKDFVLCRKDGEYSDGRRPDKVEPGTIFDDLARRDFTVNSLARDPETGEILDPHGGREDLDKRLLRCVGSTTERFQEDALRIVRAIRFMITKGFAPDDEISSVLFQSGEWGQLLNSVSRERIREEVGRCFKFSTTKSIVVFAKLNSEIREAIFKEDIWLKATKEKRKKS